MTDIRSMVAALCVALIVSPGVGFAQSDRITQRPEGGGNIFTRFESRYRYSEYAPINLRNSNRLETLIRAGNLYLSLQDAIALALENNLDIELQRYGPEIAKANLTRSLAGGALRGIPTSITAGPSSAVSLVNGGVNTQTGSNNNLQSNGTANTGGLILTQTGVAVPTFDESVFFTVDWGKRNSINTNTFVSGASTTQITNSDYNIGFSKAWASGTSVQASWNNGRVSTNSPTNTLSPFNNANLNFQVTQRLLQGFGFAVNTRNIRVAKLNQRVSDFVFEQQVIATLQSIVNLYTDLVAFNEDVKVKKQALATSEKLYNDNRKQVEIGTLAPIEIVRAEAEVASRQQDLVGSETQVLQQETILKNALSRTGVASPSVADARVITTDRLEIPDVDAVTPLQDLIQQALSSRPELKQTQLNIESSRIGILGSRSALLPSLDLVAAGTSNALAGSVSTVPLPPNFSRPVASPDVIGNYSTVLGQLFGFSYPNYSIQATLNIPLRNRTAQADLINDQISLRQAELNAQKQINSVRVDVQNATIGIQQARARYNAARKARTLQEQTLDAEQKKYALGANTIYFVIQAQRDLTTQQGAEVQALNAYNRAKVNLDLVTGQLLKSYGVELAEAVRGKVNRVSSIPASVPQ